MEVINKFIFSERLNTLVSSYNNWLHSSTAQYNICVGGEGGGFNLSVTMQI